MSRALIIPKILLLLLGPKNPLYSQKLITNTPPTTSSSDFYYDSWGQVIWTGDNLPFNSPKRTYRSSAFWKAWKRVQPIRAAWELNKNNKKTDEDKGIEATNSIRDLTFRFVNRCLSGTLWILDYEIPNDPKAYPTKFFFGTNAHIAEGIKFSNNPYKQVLPTTSSCTATFSFIFRETDLNAGGREQFMRSKWKDSEKGLIQEENPYYNVKYWLHEKGDEPPYYYFKTKDVKLAYVATNFAGDGRDPQWGWCGLRGKNYISDFAVIEVDFKNQETARRMTRDFHTKYHYKTGTKRHKAIDFFAKPLMDRMNTKKLYQKNPDIFLAGHPENGLKGKSVGSFNLDNHQTSKLTYVSDWNMIKDANNDEVIGHSNVCHLNQPLDGYGNYKFSRGIEILIEREPLRSGSSGSLATDGNRNALGVKSRRWDKVSAIDVFRSSEIKQNGKTIIPAYDLLEGIDNNKHDRSYKDTVVKYILSANRKTHLSEMRKWGKPDSEALKKPEDRKTAKQIIAQETTSSRPREIR